MIHDLKILTEHLEDIAAGRKTFEVRHTGDRTFASGDVLRLHEWDPHRLTYLGRGLHAPVSMVRAGYGMDPDYACLALGAVEKLGDWPEDLARAGLAVLDREINQPKGDFDHEGDLRKLILKALNLPTGYSTFEIMGAVQSIKARARKLESKERKTVVDHELVARGDIPASEAMSWAICEDGRVIYLGKEIDRKVEGRAWVISAAIQVLKRSQQKPELPKLTEQDLFQLDNLPHIRTMEAKVEILNDMLAKKAGQA